MKTTILKLAAITAISAGVITLSACAPMSTGNQYGPQAQAPVGGEPTDNQYAGMAPAESPVAQQQYVVQLTASSSAVKAEGIKNRFAGEGYQAFVSPLMVNDKLLHRVQIGYYNHEDDARTVLAQLQQSFPEDVYVADALVKTP